MNSVSGGHESPRGYPHVDLLLAALRLGVAFENPQGEITAANPAAEQILGLSLDQMRGVRSVVSTAEDGIEAVEKTRNGRYDLILMDMQMPRMDGLSAARAIREVPGYAQVPILAMTANAFGEDREACLGAGMTDHIAKPVDSEGLYSNLLNYLPQSHSAHADATALPATDEVLRENLEAIPGLDVAAGLDFDGGTLPFLVRLLHRFAEDHALDIRRLERTV